MKNLLARSWDALFPLPSVSVPEAFFLRVLLAAALFWFFPTSVSWQTQPAPVGLAHWMDLTWLSQPGVFPVYRAVFLGLLLLYAAGFVLPITLTLVTFLHILPPTLHNSQGFTFHGNQIMSLTLLGLTVVAWWLGATRRLPVLPKGREALTAILCATGCAAFLSFDWGAGGGSRVTIDYMLTGTVPFIPFSPEALTVVNMMVLVVFFTFLALLVSGVAGLPDGVPDPAAAAAARSWFLVTAQFVTASAYLISVFSKFIRSDGMWLVNSYYVALDFVKTLRQNYYSGLDPKYAVDPPAYIVTMMQHPVITAIFFDFGVALEAFMIFAIGYRRATFAFGACLIVMHITIAKIMNLFFPTHVAMLAIFWVAPMFTQAMSKEKRAV